MENGHGKGLFGYIYLVDLPWFTYEQRAMFRKFLRRHKEFRCPIRRRSGSTLESEGMTLEHQDMSFTVVITLSHLYNLVRTHSGIIMEIWWDRLYVTMILFKALHEDWTWFDVKYPGFPVLTSQHIPRIALWYSDIAMEHGPLVDDLPITLTWCFSIVNCY